MNFKDYKGVPEEPEHKLFILDDKEQNLVNFIGKFESLEKRFKKSL